MATDRLHQRLAELDWPAVAMDNPDPQEGQLWRASWQSSACLVVTLGPHDGRMVPVAAAGAEPVGDDAAVVARTNSSMAPVVWGGVRGHIKMFSLEHHLGDLTTESLDEVLSVGSGTNTRKWAPITNVLDDRSLIRANLADRVAKMDEAEWLPTPSPGAQLSDLVIAAGLTASDISRILTTTPGDARRLIQGKRGATSEENRLLAAHLGTVPAVGALIDLELALSLDFPEFRPALDRRANRAYGNNPVAVRRSVAEEMMAQSPRRRNAADHGWRSLLREALRED